MDKKRWQQIEDVYYAALELPEAERRDFLREKCAGDEELFKELRSLLDSHERADSFLAEPEFDLGLELLIKQPRVLQDGQNFGHYTILKFLGRGGMGEVYLAQDARLGRLIALKVLPAEVAANRDRVQRFMQEARAASALNHPNILTIYETGEVEGWRFIASEYVEGETLRERFKREAPLAPEETVEIALQIAAALNAAHKAGIIHRDIKPENIMLREDGLVKVLDFGLAKLSEPPGTAAGGLKTGADAARERLINTNPGMVMGTVAYMSPEQVRGQITDARSDIWSFGIVLYEMLTGRLPFAGDTTSDMIAAILTAEPDLPARQPVEKPETFRQIAGKALRKDPAERYQTALEMAEDLRTARLDADSFSGRDLLSASGHERGGNTDSRFARTSETLLRHRTDKVEKKSSRKNLILALAAIFVLAAAGSYAAFYFLKNANRFSREPLKIARIFETGKTVSTAVSPDGKYVVHALADAGKQSIWIKQLATNSNVQLVAPKEVDYPALTFSRDGDHIYFVQNNGELYQIPVLGGDPKKILAGVGSAISFSPDGRQFAFVRSLPGDETAVMTANADGSGERLIASRKKPEFFVGPAWSPDGETIACSVGNASSEPLANIVEIPLAGGAAERVISAQKWRAIWQAAWLSDGSGLIAPAISGEGGSDALQIWFFPAAGGAARQVTNDLNNYGDVSLTADSKTLVTIRFEQRSNIWLLPQGRSEQARLLSNNVHSAYRFIAGAPDGRIVYPSQEDSNSGRNLWIMNADGSGARQLTANAGENILPCVTGDGRHIVFASNRGDLQTYQIWRMNMDGSSPVQLTNSETGARGPACSPDSKTVFYAAGGPDAGIEKSRLWKVSIDGGEPVPLTDYPATWKDVSPDGAFIAIRFKPDKASPVKLGIITPAGGQPVKVFDLKENTQVRWKPDGRSITYIKNEKEVSNIWEQPLSGEPPRPLTRFTAETIYFFDWSKDGSLICTRGYQARDPVLISDFR